MLSTLFTVVAVTSVVFAVAGVAADATRIATLLGLVCAGTATVALLLAWASRRATRRAGAAAIADAVQGRGLGPRLATGDLARRR